MDIHKSTYATIINREGKIVKSKIKNDDIKKVDDAKKRLRIFGVIKR
ncbi:MAG: hypothetical protein KatS3mg003_0726 [Candidatus Nitrosocaldaceae archaeon]|nr:MAG: hypothetical protein KatS3mg003_0726 [Candidatus Nitrosocaldaceae archaeon]